MGLGEITHDAQHTIRSHTLKVIVVVISSRLVMAALNLSYTCGSIHY